MSDHTLNAAFFAFHTIWIAFNCLGWISKATRKWHLWTTGLTALSWFGLGAFYGWGYCPCTDWHWQVRARLGFDDPPSYIQLLVAELTGIEPTLGAANAAAVVTLVTVTVLSLTLNMRDRRRARAVRSKR